MRCEQDAFDYDPFSEAKPVKQEEVSSHTQDAASVATGETLMNRFPDYGWRRAEITQDHDFEIVWPCSDLGHKHGQVAVLNPRGPNYCDNKGLQTYRTIRQKMVPTIWWEPIVDWVRSQQSGQHGSPRFNDVHNKHALRCT